MVYNSKEIWQNKHMENFKAHITENKNTHMTHIEDRVIYGGVKGTREAP